MVEGFVVFDVGTTKLKGCLIDINGKKVAELETTYAIRSPKPLWYEIDVNNLWVKFIDIFKKLVRIALSKRVNILSLCITGQRESFLLIDHNGKPLMNCISWMDRRSIKEVALVLKKMCKEDLYEKTGLVIEPTYPLTKILWIKSKKPSIYNKAWKVLQIIEFLNYKLTGEIVTDYSLASRTLLFNVIKRRWDREILNEFNIDEDKLPYVKPSGEVIGPISDEILRIVGLRNKIFVVNGGGDRACEALGACIFGTCLGESTGTATNIMYSTERPLLDKNMRILLSCHVVGNYWLLEAGTTPTGGLLNWLSNVTNFHIYDIVNSLTIDDLAEPSGIIVLPYFLGARAPYWNTRFKGVVYGLTLATNRKQLVKGFLESIVCLMKLIVQAYEELGIKVKEIISYGGLSKLKYLNLLKANVLGKRILLLKEKYPSVIGAAILAGYGVKVYQSVIEVSRKWFKLEEIITPDPQLQDVYLKVYEEFLKVNNSMIKLFSGVGDY